MLNETNTNAANETNKNCCEYSTERSVIIISHIPTTYVPQHSQSRNSMPCLIASNSLSHWSGTKNKKKHTQNPTGRTCCHQRIIFFGRMTPRQRLGLTFSVCLRLPPFFFFFCLFFIFIFQFAIFTFRWRCPTYFVCVCVLFNGEHFEYAGCCSKHCWAPKALRIRAALWLHSFSLSRLDWAAGDDHSVDI